MANLEKLLCAELQRGLEAKSAGSVSVPAGGDLLWQWFIDLSRCRTYHMAGPNPISHQEIAAYAQVARWPIELRHIIILRAMDEVLLKHAYRRTTQRPDGVRAAPPVSSTPLTAGMVDVLFG